MIWNDTNRQVLRLPPRPRFRDWIWAGASAGFVLGMAEFAVAYPAGLLIPPLLAACVFGVEAGIVCAGSALVGLALHVRGVRLSRSGLVGAVVGPLLFASIAGSFWVAFGREGGGSWFSLAGLLLAVLLAGAAGVMASRLADALERRGFVVSAPLVWGSAALALAACERVFSQKALSIAVALAVAIAVLLAVCAVAWGAFAVVERRPSPAARPFSWLLGWLAAAAAGVVLAPLALPWVFYEPELPSPALGPPNLLVVAIPAARSVEVDPEGVTPTFESLGSAGRSYRLLAVEPEAGVRALFSGDHGYGLAPQLAAAGYATAAVFPGEQLLPGLEGAETDARAGARGLLEGRLRWLAAAPLLKGPAAVFLEILGIDTRVRSSEQLARCARHWLLEWRNDRATVPFFLFLDFRGAASPAGEASLAGRSDAQLASLLEHLEALQVASSTLVVVLRAPVGAASDERSVRVAVRAPGEWPLLQQPSDPQWIRARTLAQFLLAASRSDGRSAVALPGSR